MAYNRINKLLQMQSVIDCYLANKTDDVSAAWVHRKFIYPQFHISYRTLNTYLGTPVKKLLRECQEKNNCKCNTSNKKP